MILKAHQLSKHYPGLKLFDQMDIELRRGESLAIIGPSGAGKSTLLHLIGLLDTPDVGEIEICSQPAKKKNHALLRNRHIGFVFQSYHLLEEESVFDNVIMPARIARKDSKARAMDLIKRVGLEGREHQLAKFLSGGEKQRVAIARALCNDPDLILADEPTGNLDSNSSKLICDLLFEVCKDKALIIVTHDVKVANRCQRSLTLTKK
ncbi:MAG: ABC transporter ATP-binding protein [Chlamydiales bacterium]|nr:ABC transporter ATP-binding protein [Chlamydiales bacterium]